MSAMFIALGLWRSWVGGGVGKDWPIKHGLTWLQYALLIALAVGAEYPNWYVGGVDAVALLLLARGYGHGPMLAFPLKNDPDGDFILDFVGGPGGGTFRYLAYASIRYILPCLAWSGVLWLMGRFDWFAPAVGSIFIVGAYYGFTTHSKALPTLTTPGDEAANWAELCGWSALGLVLSGAPYIV